MVIYLEQYTAARATLAAWLKDGGCADELRATNRNPALRQLARETVQTAPGVDLPDDFSKVDMTAFLNRVRALATLV